jgi:hypothetical protein
MAKCFVIGPIGEAGSPIRAAADDFMEYIVTPVVTGEEFGYSPIRADALNEPGRITSQIIKLLMDAELVVADLTTNNANVFYELSLRHAIGKPVVHMAHEGTPLSFDVRDNRTIFYTMHSRVAEAARKELANQIRHVRQQGYKPMNPILETASIVSFERSDVPEQKAIGQVMAMIEQLDQNVLDMRQQMSRISSGARNRTLTEELALAAAKANSAASVRRTAARTGDFGDFGTGDFGDFGKGAFGTEVLPTRPSNVRKKDGQS